MNEDFNHNFEEESTMDSPIESSSFKYQKELIYNKLLPYADDLDKESQALLSTIKANLGRAVMRREIQTGCCHWIVKLYRYIRIYGMRFSKEDHILFIKLMYELITIPNLEPFLINQFGAALLLLLRKKGLVSPSELELPWRPLYRLLYRVKKSKETELGMYRLVECVETVLGFVVHAVKVYFPLSATQEILDELRPTLCPFDGLTMCWTVEMFGLFLPVQLAPEHHAIGYELWFNEFMTLWEVFHNASEWDHEMMCLMARLASHNIGYIDWEPYLPLMFTRFIRCLNLPVTYKQTTSPKHHKIQMTPIAIWIAAVLGSNTSAQMYLDKFLKTIETYFHSANIGQWLRKLTELLVKLPNEFILRLHKERHAKPTWETPIPEKFRLTDGDIDAFVKSMMPVAMTAMFSKLSVNDACHALKHLATMRPNLVIPDVLDRMYSTLDSLTEPHKLMSSMICMLAIAKPMVQGSKNLNKGYVYSEGPSQVLPLLFSFLPGIDPNDTGKCFVTFRLISIYATLIPIVDSSRSSAEMDEEERMICEATSRFEDFILQFLDRVFLLIDSSSLEFVRLESHASDGKSKLETIAETALAGVCTMLLVQTSDEIFDSALHKLRTFVTEHILETKVAGQLAAVLCRVFSRRNGRDTLRSLLPVLSQTILDVIGDGDDIIKEEHLDNRLLYAMLLLSAVVVTPGNNLLPHTNTLTKVLDRVLLLKSREGNNLACRLLKTVLHSLSTTVPYQFRTVQRDYNDPDYPYVRDWGQAPSIDSLNVKWYVPGEEEMAVIKQIFFKYLTPEVSKLQQYCEDGTTLTREELLTSLNIVSSVIGGCESLLPVWEEKPLITVDSFLDPVPFLPTLGTKRELTMPDGGNVRRYMTGIMHNLQRIILKCTEDDTKSLFVLIQIWSSLLLGKLPVDGSLESRWKHFQTAKKLLGDKLVGNKGLMGQFILERADIQHETRVQSQCFVLTETHKEIILDLVSLATSRYADVRSKAQNRLFYGLQHFMYSYRLIVPSLLDILKMDTEKHHEAYKGVLYTLLGPEEGPIILRRDWEVLRSLWPAIVLSKTSENLSVIQLKETLLEFVNKQFPTITISLEVPDTCVEVAAGFWETDPKPNLPQLNEEEIETGVRLLKETGLSNLETYNGLVEDLLTAITDGNLHWRHRIMAMNFICNLVHPEQIYSPKVVRYFLSSLIHDSLQERKVAIKAVVFMLQQQKRKHPKVTIDLPVQPEKRELNKDQAEKLIPGQRPDNAWLQYNYETRPLTAEQWDEPRFVHHSYIGYYTWPKELQVYAPSSQQPCLDPNLRQLTDHEKEIDLFFNDPQNIEKLIKFLSLEEKKGKDKFGGHKYLLFKTVFRNHGIVFLKHFLPHLRKLVTDKQESSQRCAAEIIAGIIKGAKHWPFQMTCDMWDSLLPIIRLALDNLTVETVVDWGVCFATAQQNTDPNRHHWFLECAMEEPRLGESESSFLECARLYTLQGALNQHSWRVSELLQRLSVRLENRLLRNPFENVRERLGSVLVTVFDPDLRFPNATADQSTPRVQNLVDKIIPRLQYLVEENTEVSGKQEQSCSEAVKVDDSTKDTKTNTEEREAAIRLLKTVCKWIVDTAIRSQHGVFSGFYQIFPIVVQLENFEADKELTKMCSSTLAILAQSFTLPADMPIVLEAVTKISKSVSWSSRSTSLEFLQVLAFHNMSILLSNPEWVNNVRDIVLRLLEDERLEVRENAGKVLGGLLHCKFIPEQENLLEEFKRKAKTKLPKKNRSIRDGKGTEKYSETDAVRIRHGGVLGLCAFILAHPYDIPKYLPSIFEHLGLHMNDPQPIPTSIRKTLSNFKRTHYDGWTGMNGHAQQFTEEQLAVLNDLALSPSYYA